MRATVAELLTVLACASLPFAARANEAQIVSLIGKGDARPTADAEWTPAAVKQKLAGGSFVRTREQSQMALLLKDSTQVRLNQQSILNIKAVATATQPTQLELPQGRAWSQSRPRGPDVGTAKRPILEVSTPAATAAIRGTDWELVVEPDGTSTITVLSGAVDFYNEHGRVAVAPNEQARAVKGKAPVKIFLSTAAERVQWVTSYRPDPRRWVPRPTGAIVAIVKDIEAAEYALALAALEKDKTLPRLEASLLLADMRLFLGEPTRAIALLEPYARDGQGEPMAVALLGRALLISGRISDAARVLGNAAKTHASHIEVLLAQAELARVQGDVAGARGAAERVIGIDAKNAEAWYVIGRIETEREYAKAAREALNRAIQLRPSGPGYQGELGTLETFANEFAAADAAFKRALEQTPDDYQALTGLGILQLKRGETEAALESFLKAGVIEPRYSRAWFYSGVAYYQLGEHARAHEAFEKAAKLDDKDPLPYFMQGLAYFDALELGKSIEAAREAQARLPFLKSLNQVLTDQKGSANLGSALAAFGMEEWSRAYAYDSYSPYWAGSHLFLSDRFSGTFNKNSELFKGFLSDPTVFGASNRFSSMVPVPGHYGSVGLTHSRDYLTDWTLNATVNGHSAAVKPFSYFLSYDRTDADSAINRTDAAGRAHYRGNNYILGLGLKPTHELGMFAFANSSNYDGRFFGSASGLIDNPFSIDYRRADVGFNYKFSPTNHVWLKFGEGSERTPLSGAVYMPGVARLLRTEYGGHEHSPAGRLNAFLSDQSQRDVQWRHTFDAASSLQVSWGVEFARESKPSVLDLTVPVIVSPPFTAAPTRVTSLNDSRIEAGAVYLSGRMALTTALDVQADLYYQNTRTSFVTDRVIDVTNNGCDLSLACVLVSGADREREVNPRIGLKWRPDPAHTLRLAAQVWRKPPGVNTLAPVDTVGIPLDDRTVTAGGRLKRVRAQHEMQLDASTFAQWFVDFKEIENPDPAGAGFVSDLELVDLERLRTRRRAYGVSQEYLEDLPVFGAGRIKLIGVAVNRLMSRDLTLAGRYVFADTTNTSLALPDRAIPYHPRHYANLALNWRPYARWILGASATYRGRRFTDDANAHRLDAGWALGLSGYWESADKRLSVGAVIDPIVSDDKASIYRNPTFQLQAVYRF